MQKITYGWLLELDLREGDGGRSKKPNFKGEPFYWGYFKATLVKFQQEWGQPPCFRQP